MKFIILLVFLYSNVYAKDNKIPFIINETSTYYDTFPSSGNTSSASQASQAMQAYRVTRTTEKIVNVDPSEISKILKSVRDEICNTIKDGEFKVWLKGEASGKILGVGASSESGIEVTVKCKG